MNASWHPPAPAPGRRGVADQFPSPGGRRQEYWDPSYYAYNEKALGLSKQLIYGTQFKILEIGHVIKKHESDPRFRMAYIFKRLEEWLRNMRTSYGSVIRYHRRFKILIWYYEHMLRVNIDITYSIEHLVFLHNEYMKNMEALVPMTKRKEMRDKKVRLEKERQKEIMKQKKLEEESEKEEKKS